MAMNPSHFKSGTLSLDEYKARRDWATSQQLEMLMESPEYKAHVARRSTSGRTFKRIALVALVAGLAAYFASAPAAPTAPSPEEKEPPRAPPDVTTDIWKKFSEIPFLPVSNEAMPEASWPPASPSTHIADRGDETHAAREAELRALRVSKEGLTLERDALKSSSTGLKQEVARQAAVISRLQEEAERATAAKVAVQPDAPDSNQGELEPAVLGAGAFGGLVLFGLLPLLLKLRHTKHRLHQLNALYRAAIAEVTDVREELADLQQLNTSQEAREKDAEKVAVEQEGEIRRLERALGAAEEAKRALEATLSEVRVQSARLQDNNQELTAAKELAQEELSRLQAVAVAPDPSAATEQATSSPRLTGAEFSTPQPTEYFCPNGQQPFVEPGSPGNAEEVVSQVFWPDIEFQDLSDRTRRGLASIKRRMHKAGYTKTRQRPDPNTPKTPEEYWTGMAELREQTALLKASNDSLEAQLDQVTGSLEDMMARNEGAQRMCRVRDQVIEELELMLVRKVEDGELVEAELAALRGVAEECLRCMEAGHSPPPPAVLHRMRTALAGQLAEEHGVGEDDTVS